MRIQKHISRRFSLEVLERRNMLAGNVLKLADLLNSTGAPGTAGFAIEGELFNTVGDFNRDGFDDIAIGEPLMSLPSEQVGAIHVVFGSSRGFPVPFGLILRTALRSWEPLPKSRCR